MDSSNTAGQSVRTDLFESLVPVNDGVLGRRSRHGTPRGPSPREDLVWVRQMAASLGQKPFTDSATKRLDSMEHSGPVGHRLSIVSRLRWPGQRSAEHAECLDIQLRSQTSEPVAAGREITIQGK